jgi:sugar lactone lactonase YvrE
MWPHGSSVSAAAPGLVMVPVAGWKTASVIFQKKERSDANPVFAAFGIIMPVLSVVISVFMLGLALGSKGGRRIIQSLTHKASLTALISYAWAELGIGLGAFLVPFLFLAVAPMWAGSYYTVRLDDPKAVYLSRDQFLACGDGVADDSDSIQQAIDRVQSTTHEGIVFIPPGRYRISKTLYVWPGIRVIGYGASRPVLVLGVNTPGYQDKENENYMVFFAGGRPSAQPARPRNGGASDGGPKPRTSARHGLNLSQPYDAGAGTFYSAMSNIDLEIQEGNPGAVGVRARYAQHCYMAHMDFCIGSGFAGIHDGGNEAEDLHFHGGQYGVVTRKPSPGWQFTLVDVEFEGQSAAAIKTHEAGLTLIHPVFKNVPTAIAIDPDYAEELWVKDGRMENIAGPAVIISREKSPRAQVNMENVVCRHVPVFALFRESGEKIVGHASIYAVAEFSHGLHIAGIDVAAKIETHFGPSALNSMPVDKPDLPPLPPADTWVNAQSLGAKGDGATDDTEAIRKAVASHSALYFPAGKYRVTDTITLRPNTVLVGLHPSTTAFVLMDGTPAFQGVGKPKPVIESPRGGANIMTGIGIYTNGINPRAVAAMWMAGKDSMMNDVRFLGGHGTSKIDGSREEIYNNTHSADPDLSRRWDGQYPSLWVTNGGGGRFVNIWTPSTFAQAGLYVSDTSTEGRVYQMSSEHHVRNEVVLRNVANWHIFALQTEEERGEGGFALPLEIENSRNITVANFHIYRVVSSYQPFPYAIKIVGSENIRLRNIHCYSDSKVSFDAAIHDQTHGLEVRQREFAWMTISGHEPRPRAKPVSTVLAPGAKVEKLAGGFYNISGGAASPDGDFYFVDTHWQRIYRWATESRHLSLLRDHPLDPVNLVFDKAGNLMVVSYAGKGTVYCFKPGAPSQEVTLLEPQPSAPRPGMAAALPVDYWRLENDFLEEVPVKKPYQYVSPDRTTFIPAGEDFVSGRLYYGSKLHDVLRAFGLARAVPGQPFYVSDEEELQTYSAKVDPRGTLSDVKLFADQGGEGLAVDARGNVYIGAGQIFVYSPSGQLIDAIEIPERPLQLVFGGKDGKTLFIPGRTSLYAVHTRFVGR